MVKKIVSFGRKWGVPQSNIQPKIKVIVVTNDLKMHPYSHKELRYLTGKDKSVQKFLLRNPNTIEAIKKWAKQIRDSKNIDEFWFQCEGGRHRSVYVAEVISRLFKLPVEHRDINRRYAYRIIGVKGEKK